MTQGVVLFAFDTDTTAYSDLAAWSAKRIQHHLDLPVTVVTNRADFSPPGVNVIRQDAATAANSRFCQETETVTPWHNRQRWSVYDLSPYDDTLLLDADYVVCSRDLAVLFKASPDIMAMRWAYDVCALRDFDDLNYFGQHRMPMAWATVMRFRKSQQAQLVFSMMAMIEQNYQHYKNLYKFQGSSFRNDYALSIALNTVFGHQGSWPQVPWNMATVEPRHTMRQLDYDRFDVTFVDHNKKSRRVVLQDMDFHAMNKQNLGACIAHQA